MPAQKSRPQRWAEAASLVRRALNSIDLEAINQGLADLKELQDEYEGWKDSLPESLSSSTVAEKLDEVCNLDIDGAADELESARDALDTMIGECENVDLPRGFGKD